MANRAAAHPLNQELGLLSKRFAKIYRDAEPFPHFSVDGLFDEHMLRGVLGEFPAPESPLWTTHNHSYSKKLANDNFFAWGPLTRELMVFLNSAQFLTFLEALTGIPALIPDPYYFGGGLHLIRPGGFLGVHADFNWHDRLKLDRRINLLLYLNPDWKQEYGGAIELWTPDMKTRVNAYLPLFNRLVVFNTTDFSYHGHPEPLRCPEAHCRRSIALYYYTNGRPRHEISAPHSTLYRRHSDLVNAGVIHPNLFYQWVPPVVYSLGARVKRIFDER